MGCPGTRVRAKWPGNALFRRLEGHLGRMGEVRPGLARPSKGDGLDLLGLLPSGENQQPDGPTLQIEYASRLARRALPGGAYRALLRLRQAVTDSVNRHRRRVPAHRS